METADSQILIMVDTHIERSESAVQCARVITERDGGLANSCRLHTPPAADLRCTAAALLPAVSTT